MTRAGTAIALACLLASSGCEWVAGFSARDASDGGTVTPPGDAPREIGDRSDGPDDGGPPDDIVTTEGIGVDAVRGELGADMPQPALVCPVTTPQSIVGLAARQAMDLAVSPDGRPHLIFIDGADMLQRWVGDVATGGGLALEPGALSLPQHAALRAAYDDTSRLFVLSAQDQQVTLRRRIAASPPAWQVINVLQQATVHAIGLAASGPSVVGVVAYSGSGAASEVKPFRFASTFVAYVQPASGSERWRDVAMEASASTVGWAVYFTNAAGARGRVSLFDVSVYGPGAPSVARFDSNGAVYGLALQGKTAEAVKALGSTIHYTSVSAAAVFAPTPITDATGANTMAATVDALGRLYVAYGDASGQLVVRTRISDGTWPKLPKAVLPASVSGRAVLEARKGLLHIALSQINAVRYTCVPIP